MECLEILTRQAIEHSAEIEAINQQLELTDDRQDYARNRRWTNYLTTDPIRLIQNILGGGDVQRDRLAIADLELREAELIRRRENEAQSIAEEVVGLVLNYEKLGREVELIRSQLQSHLLQVAVYESRYRTGHGSTNSMLRLWQRTDNLNSRCVERYIGQDQIVRQLEILIGETEVESRFESGDYTARIDGCDSGPSTTVYRGI